MEILKPVVKFNKDTKSDYFESWRVLVDSKDVGIIYRPDQNRTVVYATINDKNVYSNGFNTIATAKGYVRSFISRYI